MAACYFTHPRLDLKPRLPASLFRSQPKFMLTLTILYELEVDDIVSGMPLGAFGLNVFGVRVISADCVPSTSMTLTESTGVVVLL